jgi:hypothetical protein
LTVALLSTPAVAANRGGLVKVIISYRGLVGAHIDTREAIQREGGTIRRSFRLINAVAASVPQSSLAELRQDPQVKSVEIDAPLEAFHHAPDSGSAELEAAWGVEHIGAGAIHAAGNTGQGV